MGDCDTGLNRGSPKTGCMLSREGIFGTIPLLMRFVVQKDIIRVKKQEILPLNIEIESKKDGKKEQDKTQAYFCAAIGPRSAIRILRAFFSPSTRTRASTWAWER
jgi:hypothetical protein